MDWLFWLYLVVSFLIGLVVGLFADSYKYNTGRKYGLEDKEQELMPIIGRLQDELADLKERKTTIKGKYKVKEERDEV